MDELRLEPPIPSAELDELRQRLADLPVPVVIDDSWRATPPLVRTPTPHVEGGWFDVDRVVHTVHALTTLQHTKGALARTPFVPDPWQIVWVIGPVFGWRYALDDPRQDRAGTRIVRRCWVEVPRKNGKSSLCSAFALVLLAADGEEGAEVYAAATSLKQAQQVFAPAREMALASPDLSPLLAPLADQITFKPTNSMFRALSHVADAAHGLNVHGAIIDEVHIHRTRHLIDAIETGTGARRQPLIVYITTSDEGEDFTIYAEKRAEVEKLAARTALDPSVWGVIWASPEEEDPFDPATWARCNPGLNRSVSLQALETAATRAKTNPSALPSFLRLHLNRRVRDSHRWVDLSDYDRGGNVETLWHPRDGWEAFPAEWEHRRAWAGVDLSAVSDLTALGVWLPDHDADDSPGWSLTWAWLPQDGLLAKAADDQVPYDEWAREGWLDLTEGNVVDYEPMLAVLVELSRHVRLEAVGLDRWQAHRIMQELNRARVARVCVELPQTFQGLSGGCKVVERAIMSGRFRHGGHPIKRWSYSQVEVVRDQVDNIRPVKPDRARSAARIDPVMGDVMAAATWERRERRNAPSAARREATSGRSVFASSRPLVL